MNPLGWRLGLGGKKTKNIKIAKILTSFNKKKQIKVVNCDSRGN